MTLPRVSQRGSGLTTSSGSMNQTITIQQRTATNAYGQVSGAWSDVLSSWARIEHLQGREFVNAAQFAAEVTHRITMPFASGIDPKMRVEYDDAAGRTHYYDILFVQNVDERSFFLELLAKEIYSTT